ncbi:mitogen-activated protein kinase kinase kinase 2-like isoform X2 [Lytechinus variegatus]|uniref:mitogen-activated protein kinase kinase kinase 2-like isoform X2 n=1 Tax=Lytechinus variegatus TaxID=7654 RepID=UPI001BB19C11|nr:mitogen-activated protein kinase kinase kinase 2-like isoform X2 [Lytechinus variegatus]
MVDPSADSNQVISEITDNLISLRVQGNRNRTTRGGSSSHTNEIRVKFEFNGEKRILQIPRPLKFDDILRKARTTFGQPVDMFFTNHNNTFSLLIPIRDQTDLNQAVEVTDNNPNAKSLRLHLELTTPGSSSNNNGSSKRDLYDTAIRTCGSTPQAKHTSPARSQSVPQEHHHIHTSHDSHKRYSTQEMPTRDNANPSPPPGYVPADESMASMSMRHQSYGEGAFIPEPPEERIIGSPDGSQQSLDKLRMGSHSLGSATGKMFKSQSCANHEDFENSQIGRGMIKGGTFPSRQSVKTSRIDTEDGRKTFPSRGKRAPLTAMHDDQHSISDSMSSLGRSSSSGISPDYDTDSSIPRRWTEGDLEGLAGGHPKSFNLVDNTRSPRAPTNWQRGRMLGQGAFGVVYVCYDADTGRELAVKQVPTENSNTDARKEVQSLKQEIELLRNLQHPRIVQYFGCLEENGTLSIFMEFMSGGSVKDELRNYGPLTEMVTRKYTRQILEGTAYLHDHHIVHRDIKGANVLRASGNVKLADFGASTRLQTIHSHITGMKTVTGTPYWMSPEIINGEGYGRRADVWSIGCTVVEMLTTKPPWADYEAMAAIFKIATQPTDPVLPQSVSNDARNFLNLCFKKTLSERPAAAELLGHNFVRTAPMD